jgi:zinc transport system substrate-binding protein
MLLMLAMGCNSAPPAGESEGRLVVVVTLTPQVEFVEKIGGDLVHVVLMVPPGASPHTYEPTPSQMRELVSASAYFKVGSGVEFETAWLDKLLGVNPSLPVIDGAAGIELIGETHDEDEPPEDEIQRHAGTDPHVWLSPVYAKRMVENLAAGLAEVDPDNSGKYRANADAYLAELDELDTYIRQKFEGRTDRTFLTYHPSFTYLAHEYGLNQLGIEHEGKEPTPQVLRKAIADARVHGLAFVFVNPQSSARNAETVARELDGAIRPLDPLPRAYVTDMRILADALTEEFS